MANEIIDTGLQAERTRLSWSRTALAVATNGALLMHSGLTGDSVLDYLPAALVVLCAVAFWICGIVRYRFIYAAVRAGTGVTHGRIVRLVGVLSVLPGVIVLVSLIVG